VKTLPGAKKLAISFKIFVRLKNSGRLHESSKHKAHKEFTESTKEHQKLLCFFV
jgi:hypothetical protein